MCRSMGISGIPPPSRFMCSGFAPAAAASPAGASPSTVLATDPLGCFFSSDLATISTGILGLHVLSKISS